jgi:hypothetical protein
MVLKHMIWKKSAIISFIIILTAIIVFLTPFGYHIDLGPGPNYITAIIWDYSTEYNIRYFVALRYYTEFYIFRIVLLFISIRFLFGKISKKWMLITAGLTELIPLILSIPASILLNSQGENLSPIIIPIPILLAFIITLIIITNKKKLEFNSLTP